MATIGGDRIYGAYTTFSTFKLEAIQLGTNKKWFDFVLYLGATYTIGILFAFVGMYVGNYKPIIKPADFISWFYL